MTDAFPINEIPNITKNPENYRLLRKIPLDADKLSLPYFTAEKVNIPFIKAVFLDTETTGLNPESDKIIELSMIKTTINLNDPQILSIDKIYTANEDPKIGISPFITELTGLNNEILRGESFDEEKIEAFFDDARLVIAHNAKFDEAFFAKRFPKLHAKLNLMKLSWACTAKDIDWKGLGFNGYKLEYLLLKHGYFYNAHRAADDVLADIFLMIINPKALAELINSKIDSL